MMWAFIALMVVLSVMAYRNLRQQGHTAKLETWLLALDVRMQMEEDDET